MIVGRRIRRLLAVLGLIGFAAVPLRANPPASTPVDFSRQVLPILSNNCFACHGPDKSERKARLRLDTRAGAFGKLHNGDVAIVPGKPAESAVIERITAKDPSERMPPRKSGKHLKPEQVALIRQWVAEGARWTKPWALVPAVPHALPRVSNPSWPRNAIDYFILARLDREGLRPSPETDRATLIRRVTFDLTGLPPTPQEVDAFMADHSPNAYEKVVDRLLQSPHYGEHMARYWLDAARYGDTHGLHLDNYREMWPYRDWVIHAFNRNLPYDRFVIDQLAGDLLPNATLDDIIGSGFNRCHVTSNEGGAIDEEFYVRNVDDRVDTTGVVFFGMTFGCARCHDHKYDPIKQKDYYSLFAFLNSLDDRPLDGNAAQYPPIVRVTTPAEKAALARIDGEIANVRRQIREAVARVHYDDKADFPPGQAVARGEYVWIDDDIPAGAKSSSDGGINGRWNFVSAPGHPVFSGSRSVLRTATGLSQQFFEDARPGLLVGAGDRLFAHVYLDPARPPREIMLQWNTTGWNHRAYWGANAIDWGRDNTPERHLMGPLPPAGKWVRLEVPVETVGLKPGMIVTGWAFTQFDGTVYWDKAGIVTQTPQGNQAFHSLNAWLRLHQATGVDRLPAAIRAIVRLPADKRTDAQRKELVAYFIEHGYADARLIFEPLHRRLQELATQRKQIEDRAPTTLVSHERARPRPAYILKRGEYDQHGARVGRDTPGFLPPFPADLPRNRLGLARWLVSPGQPLTARVAVNRFWQQCFGTGLVKTAGDFGLQGESPSHPELLDYLAVQFQADGWNIKQFMKTLVMSATYRQSSRVTRDQLAKDPANRLLSRGPRFRLDAEEVRDQALALGDLLIEKVGGPSVKPPQPSGLWEAVGYTASNTAHFQQDHGHKVHRRSLYTFWKRTSPPPQMTALDAPSRETCTVCRERTDTPLQALLLLNEKQFVECSRALAERTLHEAGKSAPDRVSYMFRLATARPPDPRETAELLAAYKDFLADFTQDPAAAKKLIAVGESKADPKLDPAELAAWSMIGNIILNLDEVLNKG